MHSPVTHLVLDREWPLNWKDHMCYVYVYICTNNLMGAQPDFDIPAVAEHTLYTPACNDALDVRISLKTKHLMQIQRKGQRIKIKIQWQWQYNTYKERKNSGYLGVGKCTHTQNLGEGQFNHIGTTYRAARASVEAKDLSFTPTGGSVPRMENNPIIQGGAGLEWITLQA